MYRIYCHSRLGACCMLHPVEIHKQNFAPWPLHLRNAAESITSALSALATGILSQIDEWTSKKETSVRSTQMGLHSQNCPKDFDGLMCQYYSKELHDIPWRELLTLRMRKREHQYGDIHKGDLQHSLLTQFPLVCGKNVRIPFKRRESCQSGNARKGKMIPFPMWEFPKCSL